MEKPFHFGSEYYWMVNNDSVEKPLFFVEFIFSLLFVYKFHNWTNANLHNNNNWDKYDNFSILGILYFLSCHHIISRIPYDICNVGSRLKNESTKWIFGSKIVFTFVIDHNVHWHGPNLKYNWTKWKKSHELFSESPKYRRSSNATQSRAAFHLSLFSFNFHILFCCYRLFFFGKFPSSYILIVNSLNSTDKIWKLNTKYKLQLTITYIDPFDGIDNKINNFVYMYTICTIHDR